MGDIIKTYNLSFAEKIKPNKKILKRSNYSKTNIKKALESIRRVQIILNEEESAQISTNVTFGRIR